MKKETAVEALSEYIRIVDKKVYADLQEMIEQCKQMEKEQIKDAWINSLTKGDFNSADEYYNETYKKTEQ